MWARMMTIAFLTNGLGAFGLRIISGLGLSEHYKLPYLALWYCAGFLFAAVVSLRRDSFPTVRELGYGATVALCSLVGQIGMALALDHAIPGYVVFQVAPGGGVLLVVMIGTLFFNEPISKYGAVGVALGTISLFILGL